MSLASLTRLPGDGTCNSWATPWETQALPERAICTGRKLKNKKVRVKLEKEENSRKVVRKAKNAFLEQPQRCAEAKYVSFAPNSQFEWAIDLKARAASAATSSGWEPGSLHQQLRAACVQPEREKKKKQTASLVWQQPSLLLVNTATNYRPAGENGLSKGTERWRERLELF